LFELRGINIHDVCGLQRSIDGEVSEISHIADEIPASEATMQLLWALVIAGVASLDSHASSTALSDL